MIYFICGCEAKMDPPITRENFKTFDSIVEDSTGHLVCLTHHERLKGWRSVPYTAATMPPGISTASWTPLEYERWRIFGEIPRVKALVLTDNVPDNRDNRDPQQLGEEYLAAMLVGHNGNIVKGNRFEEKRADGELRADWPR